MHLVVSPSPGPAVFVAATTNTPSEGLSWCDYLPRMVRLLPARLLLRHTEGAKIWYCIDRG